MSTTYIDVRLKSREKKRITQSITSKSICGRFRSNNIVPWEEEGGGAEKEKRGSGSLETSSISTAGNAADAALCSTWLLVFTKLTATKMSVYCSPAEQDKPTDGPLHSKPVERGGEPSQSGRGLYEGDVRREGIRRGRGAKIEGDLESNQQHLNHFKMVRVLVTDTCLSPLSAQHYLTWSVMIQLYKLEDDM